MVGLLRALAEKNIGYRNYGFKCAQFIWGAAIKRKMVVFSDGYGHFLRFG